MSDYLNLCLSDYEHQVFVYIRARIHIKNNIALKMYCLRVTQFTRAFLPSQLGHLTQIYTKKKNPLARFLPAFHVTLYWN